MDLTEAVTSALAPQVDGALEVLEVRALAGGACQDLFRVGLRINGAERAMVIRSDARSSLPGSIGRTEEFPVIRAAVEAGVRTPAVSWLVPDLVREGSSAYFMDWVDGIALGGKVAGARELAGAREVLPGQLAEQLARVHSITPATHPQLSFSGIPRKGDPVDTALSFNADMLDRLPERHPALELAFKWLRDHAPRGRETTLVHGDFRTGNFMVDASGLVALLDWEFAHWATPAEDLGWLCVRDWRFGQLQHAAGGICPREVFYRAYEAASGREVDAEEVHWWEVCGNVRWAAGAIYQGERYLSGQDPDLEYLAIARRAAEMEYEALRLLKSGPTPRGEV